MRIKQTFMFIAWLSITASAVFASPPSAPSSASTPIAYGLRWNATGDAYTLGTVVNGYFVPTPSLISFPVQERMKRCVINDAGVVQYYLCPTNSAQKADCATASVLDGTDGQVMVEIPQFHYLQVQSGTFRYFLVGEKRFSFILPGGTVVNSAVHPVFYKGGSTTPSAYRYVGAYEANLWDASATSYVGGVSITEDCVNDKLASVSGVLPIVNFTRPCGRTMAAARGSGWHQYDHAMHAAIHILYLTEYGTLRSQTAIGNGIVNYNTWPNAPQALAGNSNSIGNATGSVNLTVNKWAATTAYSLMNTDIIPNATQNGYTYRCTTAGTSAGSEPTWPTTIGNTVVDGTATWTCVRSLQYMSYRGVENWWGHVWKFVDGANIHNATATGSRLFLSTNHSQYADNTETNYTLAGTLPSADGYPIDILNTLGIWPKTVGGSSSTYLADYFYTEFDTAPDGGWRVALLGGIAVYGTSAGASFWYSNYSSSNADSNVGGRLCF